MKKRNLLFLAAIFCLSLAMVSSAHAYTWYSYGGNQYALTTGYESWGTAEAEAVSQGGHLATLTDSAQVAYLTSQFANVFAEGYGTNPWYALFWIGLYDTSGATTGSFLDKWAWSSGSTSAYWESILYNGGTGWNGVYAYLHTEPHPYAGTINNDIQYETYSSAYGLIERNASVPAPAALLLLAPGLAGVGIIRRRFLK